MLWPFVIQPAFDRTHDSLERIFAVLDGYRSMLLHTECRTGCPIGRIALESDPEHEKVRSLLWLNFDNWSKAIQQCLDESKDRLPEDIDPKALGRFVLVAMEGAVMLARTSRDISVFDEAVQQLRDYFERLIQAGSTWSAKEESITNA